MSLVILKVVVGRPENRRDVDFEQRLAHGVGLFDKAQITLEKPGFRGDECGSKLGVAEQCGP
jgi:hypothetical protein